MTDTPSSRRRFLAASAAGAGLLAGGAFGSSEVRAASPPERIDDAISVRDFGALCDGKADDGPAIQAAIEAAQQRVDKTHGTAPAVIFPPGTCRITRPLIWKSCPLIGVDPGISTRIVWDGPDDGGPALNKPRGFIGGGWTNRLEGISFEVADEHRQPAAWLRIDDTVDKFFLLRRVRFKHCRRDAIVLTLGWINLHWEHLRWDHIGGYAIRAIVHPNQHLSSFSVENFTYDHSIKNSRCSGFVYVHNRYRKGNLGTMAFRHARVEINEPWAENSALFTYRVDGAPPPRSLGLMIEGIDYHNGTNTNDGLLRLDSPEGGSESFIIMNCRATGLKKVLTGNWADGQLLPEVPSNGCFSLMLINAGDFVQATDRVVAASGLGVGNSEPAAQPGSLVRKIEVFDAEGRSLGFLPVYDRID
jgi:hypothetical protein